MKDLRMTVSSSPVPPPPHNYRLLDRSSETGMPVFYPAYPYFRLAKDRNGMPRMFDLLREHAQEKFVLARGSGSKGM